MVLFISSLFLPLFTVHAKKKKKRRKKKKEKKNLTIVGREHGVEVW